MLKKVGFGLLLFALAIYAIDPFTQNFERPWNYEYKWPRNSSVVDYVNCFFFCPAWNINVIQTTADGLATSAVEPRYADGKSEAAHIHYLEAKNIQAQTNEFTDYGFMMFFLNVEDACKIAGIETCPCYLSNNYFICSDIELAKEIRYRIATRFLSPEYSKAWKGAVDGALDSLEDRVARLNVEINALDAKYREVNYTGICLSDVSGYESCENAENLLRAAQGDSSADTYNITLIRNALNNNSLGVYNDVPRLAFGWLANSIGNENGGVIGEAVAASSELEAHYKQVARAYSALASEAEEEISNAKAANSSAAYHELWRIRVGPQLTGVVGGSGAQVSSLAREGATLLQSSLESKRAALSAMAYQNRGYLRDALLNMTTAKLLAAQAGKLLSEALAEAELVAGEYEDDAVSEARKAYSKFEAEGWVEIAKALYDAAEKEINEGRDEPRLGRKFVHYTNAIRYAQQAHSVSPGSKADGNWSAIAECARASDLISRAARDGIDVAEERAYLSVINRTSNATTLLKGCKEIAESIVLSAQYKYSHLGPEREELVYLLGICGADCNDLVSLLEVSEKGLVADGSVIYPDAVGSLRELETAYSKIKSGAVQSIVQQVGSYLSVSKTLYIGEAELDRPRLAKLEVSVANTVNYEGQNVEAEVESPLEFDMGNVVFGADKLRGTAYLDGKLRLYIRDIGALARENFVFERSQVVLRTTDVETEASALEDYSAKVAETREVECAVGVPGFYAEDYWEGVSVDGINARILDGYVQRGIPEGSHIVKATYTVENAYRKNISGITATKIGNRVYCTYQVWFQPNMDLKYLESFAALPAGGEVKGAKVTTISGEKVDAVQTASGFSLLVHGLTKGKTAKVEISYYVDNSSEYAAAEIARLKQMNLSKDASNAVEDAERKLAANNSAGAVGSIQQAYEIIEQERAQNEKLRSDYDKYYALADGERARIRNVLASGDFESDFRDLLSARADYLDELLGSLEDKSLSDKVAALMGYDKAWMPAKLRAYKKDASAEINSMQATYLAAGVENETLAEMFSVLREEYNSFESSASLEDAYALAMAIANARKAISEAEGRLAEEKAHALDKLQALRNEISGLLADYSDEYSAAKGTRFEGLFKIKPADAQAMLKQADADLKKGNASVIARTGHALAALKSNLSDGLDYLETLAKRTSLKAKEAVAAVSGMLSEKNAKEAARLSSEMDEYIGAKEFAKALKDADAMLAIAAAGEEGDKYGSIIWLSVIFVVVVIAVYFFKEKKGGKADKIFKKLEKAA